MGEKAQQQDQEDCMTNLAMMMFEPGNGFGLWMFLSIGAVALFVVFIPLTSWIDSQRKEREAFYKAETVRRLTESSGEGAKAAIELMREQDRMERRKKSEGMKIGGLINIAVGVGLMVFLRALVGNEPVYLCGLIPGLIGVALLSYALLLAPKAE
jgi:Flp pilus assembly protein TadB